MTSFISGQNCGQQGGGQQVGDVAEGSEVRPEGRDGDPRVHGRRNQHPNDLRRRCLHPVLREN